MATDLLLMGLRGAGKSAVGRDVAGRLGRPFIDLDDLTAAALACPTPGDALRRAGINAFRRAESDQLRAVLTAAPGGRVIALGGGTPTAPGAADLLAHAARVIAGAPRTAILVYLRAGADELRRRLAADDADRPSLTGAPPLDEIDALLARRDGLYRRLATAVVETDGLSVGAAADGVMRVIAALDA